MRLPYISTSHDTPFHLHSNPYVEMCDEDERTRLGQLAVVAPANPLSLPRVEAM